MRKITLLLFLFLLTVVVNSQNLVNDYQINEDFQDEIAPWGFTAAANTTITIFDAGSPRNHLFQLDVASTSGRRISNKVFSPAFSTDLDSYDGKLYVEFEWQSGTPSGGNRGFIRLLDGTSIIMAIGTEGNTNTNVLHYGNLDAANQNALVSSTLIIPEEGNFPRNEWYHVKLKLDFTTKKIDQLVITRLSNNFSWIISDKDFINNSAIRISKIEIEGGRQGATNGAWKTQIDNLKIYTVKESAGVADVTINYIDQNLDIAKTSRIEIAQPIGVPYTASSDDKLTFTDNGNYYAYDAANTVSDQVVVAEGGSEINLKFKKTAITDGTYTWKGTTEIWNELAENFTTDGTNNIGYQNNNPIIFDATATSKTAILSGVLNTGENDILVSSDEYSFSGSGSISGTGALKLNLTNGESANINITNSLSGGIVINGGTAVILKDAAASHYNMADGSTINISTGSSFNKAISAIGSITIVPTTNSTYTSTITGADEVNYSLISAGAVTTAGAFSGLPILNNTFSGAINATTTTPSAMFGATIGFANNKLALGENVKMVYPINPAADGTTTVAIGELSGAVGSKLMGPRLRTLNYNIGGLNTDATFDGTIENYPADAWSNIPVINIIKSGNGVLTLTGQSSEYVAGSVIVNNGVLEVNGTLGTSAIACTVNENGTLSGTGTIGGASSVTGTLNGSLNFGSSLTLAGTTNLELSGFGEGQFDHITVTGDLTLGGTLNITIVEGGSQKAGAQKAKAAEAQSATLYTAANIVGTFAQVNVPTGYRFEPSTGVISINQIGTGIGAEEVSFEIYPTITRDQITAKGNINRIEVVALNGQVVKQIQMNSTSERIDISTLAAGSYLVKAFMTNGQMNVRNIIVQK